MGYNLNKFTHLIIIYFINQIKYFIYVESHLLVVKYNKVNCFIPYITISFKISEFNLMFGYGPLTKKCYILAP